MSTIFGRIENLSFEYPSCAKAAESDDTAPWRRKAAEIRHAVVQQLEKRGRKQMVLGHLRFLQENVIVRGVVGFLITFSILFMILFYQNEVAAAVSLPICTAVASILTIAFVLCKSFRCVVILSIPNFATQQGRFVLFAVITGILVGGPLTTFSRNLCEFGKSAKCMAQSTLTKGEEIMKMHGTSTAEAYGFIDSQIEKLRVTKEFVDRELKPLKDALSTIQSRLSTFEDELQEFRYNCVPEVETARHNCVARTETAFNRCKLFMPSWITDVCEVVFIATDVCEPVLNYQRVCSPLDTLREVTADLRLEIEFLEEAFSVTYEMKRVVQQTFKHTINATALEIKIREYFDNALWNIVLAMTIFKYCFLSMALLIPVRSYLLLRKVKQGILTSRKTFLERFPEYNELERQRELWSQSFLLLLHLMFTLTVFGVDYACFWVQHSVLTVGDHGNVTAENAYDFHLNSTVGQGLLMNPFVDFQNDYLNNLSHQFRNTFSFSSSTADCFPKPVESTGIPSLLLVLSIYVLVFVLQINANRILKYRLDIIYSVLPELQLGPDPTLIPYSIPSVHQSDFEAARSETVEKPQEQNFTAQPNDL